MYNKMILRCVQLMLLFSLCLNCSTNRTLPFPDRCTSSTGDCTSYLFDGCTYSYSYKTNRCLVYPPCMNSASASAQCCTYEQVSAQAQFWYVCYDTCCNSDLSQYDSYRFIPNYFEIQKCQDHLTSQSTKSLLAPIIPSIILFMLFLVLGILYLLNCCGLKDKLQMCGRRCRKSSIDPPESSSQLKIRPEIVWVQAEVTPGNIDVCSICLEDSGNIMLPCKHFLHWFCLATWISQKKDCPVCRSDDIGLLQVYCAQCKNKFYALRIDNLISLTQDGVQNCQNCPASKRKERMIQS